MTTNSELQTKYDDVKMIFDNILRTLEHEDAKANRLIVAMAFITAAAAALFAHLHTPVSQAQAVWTFGLTQMGWVTVVFSLYIGLVLLGTLLMIAALGPRLYIPKHWEEGENKTSRIFFRKIAERNKDDWMNELLGTPVHEFRERILRDLAFETHILSTKTCRKVAWMSKGRDLYRYSLAFLLSFIAFAITSDGWLGFGISLVCFMGILTHHMLEESALPGSQKANVPYILPTTWATICINAWLYNRGRLLPTMVIFILSAVFALTQIYRVYID